MLFHRHRLLCKYIVVAIIKYDCRQSHLRESRLEVDEVEQACFMLCAISVHCVKQRLVTNLSLVVPDFSLVASVAGVNGGRLQDGLASGAGTCTHPKEHQIWGLERSCQFVAG